MVQSTPFVLDDWLRQQRPQARATLHDTAVAPLSLADLAALADPEGDGTSNRSILTSLILYDMVTTSSVNIHATNNSLMFHAELEQRSRCGGLGPRTDGCQTALNCLGL